MTNQNAFTTKMLLKAAFISWTSLWLFVLVLWISEVKIFHLSEERAHPPRVIQIRWALKRKQNSQRIQRLRLCNARSISALQQQVILLDFIKFSFFFFFSSLHSLLLRRNTASDGRLCGQRHLKLRESRWFSLDSRKIKKQCTCLIGKFILFVMHLSVVD